MGSIELQQRPRHHLPQSRAGGDEAHGQARVREGDGDCCNHCHVHQTVADATEAGLTNKQEGVGGEVEGGGDDPRVTC